MSGGEFSAPRWGRVVEPLYRGLTALFHGLHDRNYLERERLDAPVVSVGNLTVGGTGKTPVVEALAAAWQGAGRRPAVLTRGYGGGDPVGVLLAGMREGRTVSAAEVGDEPLWLSRRLPDVPVVLGGRRAAGGRELLRSGRAVDVFLLDDGFQHRQLHRDVDLVLLDYARPLGNGRLLPAGPLREGPAALRRAEVVMVTGAPGSEPGPACEAVLREHNPDATVHVAQTRPGSWRRLGAEGGTTARPSGPVVAVAGIARPERFRKSLEEDGVKVLSWHAFADHHPFAAGEVQRLEAEARAHGAALVTTAKDAVRLERLADPDAPWTVLESTVELAAGWPVLAQEVFRRANERHRAG